MKTHNSFANKTFFQKVKLWLDIYVWRNTLSDVEHMKILKRESRSCIVCDLHQMVIDQERSMIISICGRNGNTVKHERYGDGDCKSIGIYFK